MRYRTLVLSVGFVGVGAIGQGGWGSAPVPGFTGTVLAQSRSDDAAVRRAFRSALDREPTSRELRRYARLMDNYEWSEADVRRDLGERSDYQRHSSNWSTRPEVVIRRAYQDILGRDPDAQGLRHYETRMTREGWTEQDIREALRKSPEYASVDRQQASADRIIRQAYRQILQRDPDAEGLRSYRQLIVDDGWEEHDVRMALGRSPERRQEPRQDQAGRQEPRREQRQELGAINDAQAAEMVRRAYRSVLQREPDASGLREYKARIIDERWTEEKLVQALRESPEYRNRNR